MLMIYLEYWWLKISLKLNISKPHELFLRHLKWRYFCHLQAVFFLFFFFKFQYVFGLVAFKKKKIILIIYHCIYSTGIQKQDVVCGKTISSWTILSLSAQRKKAAEKN